MPQKEKTMTKKLSDMNEAEREIEREKRREYKARYKAKMSDEKRAEEARKSKEYKAAHKEEIRAKRAEYTEKNRERIAQVKKEYDKAYYAENHERIKKRLAAGKHWQFPKSKERIKKYEEDNKEWLTEYRREYYKRNREHKIRAAIEYCKNNPDKVARWRKNADQYRRRVHNLNRKLRIKQTGKLSIDLVPRLMALQKGKCRACGKPLKDDYHIDHIVPLAKGGPNTDSNCQLLHSKCNLSKGAKDPYDYALKLGRLFL
jgi:5-methylcytosine-specific restriction endonuclease McrA